MITIYTLSSYLAGQVNNLDHLCDWVETTRITCLIEKRT